MLIEPQTPAQDAAWATITAAKQNIRSELQKIQDAAPAAGVDYVPHDYFTATEIVEVLADFCRDEAAKSGEPLEDVRGSIKIALDTFSHTYT